MGYTLTGALVGAILGAFVGLLAIAIREPTHGAARDLAPVIAGAAGAIVGVVAGAAQAIVEAISDLGRNRTTPLLPGPRERP